MESIIKHYFGVYGAVFYTNLQYMLQGILRSGSSNTADISRSITRDTKEGYKANEMRIYRFLQHKGFQIDDKIWRRYIKIVFDALIQRQMLNKEMPVIIKIDFTTCLDYFLILTASLDIGGRSVPIFFTTRKYPRSKGQIDQKKMEGAFVRGLRHILPKNYQYILVADRGFGNHRFAHLCQESGFQYVLRINNSLGLLVDGKKTNLDQYYGAPFDQKVYVTKWKETHRLLGLSKGNHHWFLLTNLISDSETIRAYYQTRFGIEKCFQDQKTSGFQIESTKIRKYDRFKRLYFCVCLAQLFTVLLGDFVCSTKKQFKKNLLPRIA